MSNIKIFYSSLDIKAMMMRRGRIPETGAYDTVKSTPSSMNDTSAQFLEYISYCLSMTVFLTLEDIIGCIFCV